jgi:predicted ribosome quality control (RQC) complex YloA/Tae2 family protein
LSSIPYQDCGSMKIVTKYFDDMKANIEFRIGQNAKENFEIIDSSKHDDLWFHVHIQPSCHVVATINDVYDRKQLQRIAIQGAVLCKQYSKFKSHQRVQIIYTKIKHVKKQQREGAVSVNEYKKLIL